MKYTRRLAMTGFMGVVATGVAANTLELGAQQSPCSGNVRRGGQPLYPGRVERAGARSLDIANTDSNGDYKFPMPAAAGTYQLRFRDNAGSVFHTVDLLTSDPKIVQTVSVTAPPPKPTFHSLYNSLQALESLIAFAQAFPQAREALQQQDLPRLKEAVNTLRQAIAGTGLPNAQVAFLTDKATTVERLSGIPLG
jgi:hypothetical protein